MHYRSGACNRGGSLAIVSHRRAVASTIGDVVSSPRACRVSPNSCAKDIPLDTRVSGGVLRVSAWPDGVFRSSKAWSADRA